MDRPRIGFVGTGGMGQCAHLRNYVALSDMCDVVAVAELRENTGKRVAEKYRIKRVYANAAEMMRNEELDAIVASQHFGRHGVILKELIAYGKPIFIEKPLAHSIEVGREIVAAAAAKTRIMVGYHKRSDPAVEYTVAVIRELRCSEELGKLTYVRLLMPAGDWVAGGFFDLVSMPEDSQIWLEFDPAPKHMDAETFTAYTAFVNYFIHQVNLLRHLFGEDYSVQYADPTGKLLVARSESGLPGIIEMSPYHTTVDWQEHAFVAFERGYVKIDLPAPMALNRPGKVEIMKDAGNGATPVTIRPQLPWVHAMRRQAENFIRFVKGEADAPCGAEEALKDLVVAEQYINLVKGGK